jgi:hypothetical protein
MIPVRSSNLAGVDYDQWSGTLTIAFHNGRVYEYFHVPSRLVEQLLAAASLGQFHASLIKNVFAFRLIR